MIHVIVLVLGIEHACLGGVSREADLPYIGHMSIYDFDCNICPKYRRPAELPTQVQVPCDNVFS